MAKYPTFPTLYDGVLQIHISKLKEWGYLKPNQQKSGSIKWSRNGNKTGAIDITVNTNSDSPYLELDYRFREKPMQYRVKLVSVPANIGKGRVWYFLCPATNKRCRNLYSIGGQFLHREAFEGCMYESQTQSKKYRQLDKTFGAYLKLDSLYEQLYSKHFKRSYAGKPTKKYLRLMKQIRKAESVSHNDFEQALIS
ncbi:hypothetical protein [Nafulsella turpanensis]|uniref:hypothetical protein n=1 Tax=Nafulsella turpanensis TaxID=1265690 RepID=UPI00034C7B7A|nr:hypothetical protein [Nafulsella turpanensis]